MHRASSIDVDARLTPPDPPGKPAAPANPVAPCCGRRRAAARSHSARATVPPTPGRTSPWRPSAASASRSPASASRRTRSSARPRWRNTASPPLRSPARAQVEAGERSSVEPRRDCHLGRGILWSESSRLGVDPHRADIVSSAPRLIDGSVEPVAEMPVPSPPAPAELPAESPGARASAAVVAMAAIVEWRAMCMKWSLRQRGWLPLNTETPGGWITRGVVRAGNRIVRGKPRRSLSAGGGGPRAPHAPSLVSSPTRW